MVISSALLLPALPRWVDSRESSRLCKALQANALSRAMACPQPSPSKSRQPARDEIRASMSREKSLWCQWNVLAVLTAGRTKARQLRCGLARKRHGMAGWRLAVGGWRLACRRAALHRMLLCVLGPEDEVQKHGVRDALSQHGPRAANVVGHTDNFGLWDATAPHHDFHHHLLPLTATHPSSPPAPRPELALIVPPSLPTAHESLPLPPYRDETWPTTTFSTSPRPECFGHEQRTSGIMAAARSYDVAQLSAMEHGAGLRRKCLDDGRLPWYADVREHSVRMALSAHVHPLEDDTAYIWQVFAQLQPQQLHFHSRLRKYYRAFPISHIFSLFFLFYFRRAVSDVFFPADMLPVKLAQMIWRNHRLNWTCVSCSPRLGTAGLAIRSQQTNYQRGSITLGEPHEAASESLMQGIEGKIRSKSGRTAGAGHEPLMTGLGSAECLQLSGMLRLTSGHNPNGNMRLAVIARPVQMRDDAKAALVAFWRCPLLCITVRAILAIPSSRASTNTGYDQGFDNIDILTRAFFSYLLSARHVFILKHLTHPTNYQWLRTDKRGALKELNNLSIRSGNTATFNGHEHPSLTDDTQILYDRYRILFSSHTLTTAISVYSQQPRASYIDQLLPVNKALPQPGRRRHTCSAKGSMPRSKGERSEEQLASVNFQVSLLCPCRYQYKNLESEKAFRKFECNAFARFTTPKIPLIDILASVFQLYPFPDRYT
ncbi:uncharacterized protein MYCFIDRAFT_176181 [Pseudocercospora fijiensis CIRAD86]|uniref:Uncharacterized protein n=1 Tax=Pseudocercospora fijiensis (strain CIRAD86) TaxID=383855 RepID=M3AUJ0_PSEFD|nr:uncharacterized protein MYCFIDRAFT_176181 [Pseudocercospora fijiensis CIRAD86]EME80798.1 hypothetical protein MYCFIDRAFT_176181 [Pseudocercospora fijiensis CIRAD86]